MIHEKKQRLGLIGVDIGSHQQLAKKKILKLKAVVNI